MTAAAQPDGDLLTGIQAIAQHCGWTMRATKHRHEKGLFPTFTLGNSRTVYARRSELEAHFARASAERRSPSADDPSRPPAAAAVLYGHRAIAAHLGMPAADVARLDLERRLPTYLDDGCTIASTAALDHWNSMKGGR